jgi:acetyl-CoA acetyltransferase
MHMSLSPGSIVITGVGESDVGVVPGKSSMQLAMHAALEALADAGLDKSAVDGLFVFPSYLDYEVRYASLFAEYFGMDSEQARIIETLGLSSASSSGQAFQLAAACLSAGLCNIALVVSGDSFRSYGSGMTGNNEMVLTQIALTRNKQYENPYAPLVPAIYALIAGRYLADYGVPPEHLAAVPVTARQFGSINPRAQKYGKALSVEDVLNSPLVADPLHNFDCALVSDGGAAFVLERAGYRSHLAERDVTVLASETSYGTGVGKVYDSYSQMPDVYSMRDGTANAARRVFAAAGVGRKDIDIIYSYDCFSITSLLNIEGMGYAGPGEAGALFASGFFSPDGEVPWNTHGGLLSYAHPGYPGGLFMFSEAVRQLRGEAHGFQAKAPKLAYIQGHGGQLSIFPATILGRAA